VEAGARRRHDTVSLHAIAQPAPPEPPAVAMEHLSKIYDLPTGSPGSQVVAADDLNLSIAAGQIFGLVGPNGAGKTTTLKMVCGLLVPTSGRVTVYGIDVERTPEAAQGVIGYLADFFSLYDDLKVWEYLDYFAHAYKMAPRAIRGRIADVIHMMGLEPKRDAFIGGLSRGMKQRLGLARAILHDPPVLVLDEPAVGLDAQGRLDFKHLVKALARGGKTVLITSHLLADLEELCTAIAIIERGRLLRAGPLEQILRDAAGTRRVRIRVASPRFPLAEWLSARRGVSGIAVDGAGCEFAFAGGDDDLAGLVRALVEGGAPVYAVEELTQTLETAVSRLSSGTVM
jgi:ABC-2 type transport system ATP-binding protein